MSFSRPSFVVVAVVADLDSFAQLRDEEAALKAELKSRCVVCGISRNEFDRGGNVFYDHVTHDHCM